MPAQPCDRCRADAVVWQRYGGEHLCDAHLRESVEKRARKELSAQADLPRDARVVVAYSGGKDSTVALHLMADARVARPDIELLALTVDEGIAGYRPPAIALAKEVARELRIEHAVRRTRDAAGVDVDAADKDGPGASRCGFCGVFRRRLMNDYAREVGAHAVVTGHNLDDVSQSVLMNLATANLDRLAKLAPHDEAREGFVGRLLPLRSIPETEVFLYAHLRGLRWHDDECPYAAAAQRGVYRDVLYKLEETRPGTRHSLLRTHEQLKPLLVRTEAVAPMRGCNECGEPTSGLRCKACEFRAQYRTVGPPVDGDGAETVRPGPS